MKRLIGIALIGLLTSCVHKAHRYEIINFETHDSILVTQRHFESGDRVDTHDDDTIVHHFTSYSDSLTLPQTEQFEIAILEKLN